MISVMAAIFVAASLPGNHLTFLTHSHYDKLCHLIAYAALAASLLLAFHPLSRRRPVLLGITVIFLCLIYGLLEELYQSHIPHRVMDGRDVTADVVGATLAVLVWYLVVLKRSAPKR